MDKLPLVVNRLAKSGYLDIEILYGELVAYMEMKTSSIKEKSGFRYFYYTRGVHRTDEPFKLKKGVKSGVVYDDRIQPP